MQKTWMARQEDVGEDDRDWYLVDATDVSLGRLASKVSTILQGKNKPTYTPHVDVGDNVVVINAAEVELTGNKLDQKHHYSHSGYLGNLKQISYRELLEQGDTLPVGEAVRRMMPKTNLGDRMLKKLFIYPDEEHPHQNVNLEKLGVE